MFSLHNLRYKESTIPARSKLHPIKEGAKYRLFLKSEVLQRKWQ